MSRFGQAGGWQQLVDHRSLWYYGAAAAAVALNQ